MSIEENKLKKFEEICNDTAKQDKYNLENEVSEKLSNATKEKLEQYSSKIHSKYELQIKEIEKEFNKKVSDLRINQKKILLDEKWKEQEDVCIAVFKKLKEYTNTSEYANLLNKMIRNILNEVSEARDKKVYVLKKDESKLENFDNAIILPELEGKYIGGAIIQADNMIVDNTFLTALEEHAGGM